MPLPQKKPRKTVNRVTQDQVFDAISGLFGKGGGKADGGAVRQYLAQGGFYDQGVAMVNGVNASLKQTHKEAAKGFMGVDQLAKGTAHVASNAEDVHEMFGMLPGSLKQSTSEMKKLGSATQAWSNIVSSAQKNAPFAKKGGSSGGGGGGGGRPPGGSGGGGPNDPDDPGFGLFKHPITQIGAGLASRYIPFLGSALNMMQAGGGWLAVGAAIATAVSQLKNLQDSNLKLFMSVGGSNERLDKFKTLMNSTQIAAGLSTEKVAELGYAFHEAGMPIDGTVADLGAYLNAAGKFSRVTGASAEASAKLVVQLRNLGLSGEIAEEKMDDLYKMMQINNLSVTEFVGSLAASDEIWNHFGAAARKSISQVNFDMLNMQGTLKSMNMDIKDAGTVMTALSDQEVKMKMSNYIATRTGIPVPDLFKMAGDTPDAFFNLLTKTQSLDIGKFSGPRKLMNNEPMGNQERMFAQIQMDKMVKHYGTMFGPDLTKMLNKNIVNFENQPIPTDLDFKEAYDVFNKTPLGGSKIKGQFNSLTDAFQGLGGTISGTGANVGGAVEGLLNQAWTNPAGVIREAANGIQQSAAAAGQAARSAVQRFPGIPPVPVIPTLTMPEMMQPAGAAIPKVSSARPANAMVPPPPAGPATGSVYNTNIAVPAPPLFYGTTGKFVSPKVPKGVLTAPPPEFNSVPPPPPPPTVDKNKKASIDDGRKMDQLIASNQKIADLTEMLIKVLRRDSASSNRSGIFMGEIS